MALPALIPTKQKKRSVTVFGGYCHDERAGAERFYDMENLCGDKYPLLSSRLRRASLGALTKPNGIWAHGAFMWADGTKLYYDGAEVGVVADSPKQFVNLGSSVLIWPDKLKYDTENDTLSPLGASFTSSGTVSFSMCNFQGEAYSSYTASASALTSPSGGDLWLDTSVTPNALKRYSDITEGWITLSASYIRIECAGIGAGFSAYDGVSISGAETDALNGSALVYAVGTDWVLIAGTLEAAVTQGAALTITREIPDFDFLCERDNRVWGCSSARHEIACCKLGDPGNWSCNMGISTDSYTLSVGSGGDFTACCAFGGNVLFFKEDRVLKMFGTRPENFQLVSTLCRGVAQGSSKSLVQLDGALYYLSRGGVCAYGGSLPESIGEELGVELYEGAGGDCEQKYYLSARDAQNNWSLFAYDTRTGLWYREDSTHALGFASCAGELRYLAADGTGAAIKQTRYAGSGTEESNFTWNFETGELVENGHARLARLLLRFEAEAGASAELWLSYDGGDFEHAGQFWAERKRPVLLPLKLKRCDSLKLRVEGKGEMSLFSMKFIFEDGGEY